MHMSNTNPRRINRRSQASRRGSRERQRLRRSQYPKNPSEAGFDAEDEERDDEDYASTISENEGDIFSSSFNDDDASPDDPDYEVSDANDDNTPDKGNYFQQRRDAIRQPRRAQDQSLQASSSGVKHLERSQRNRVAATHAFEAVDKLIETLNSKDDGAETSPDGNDLPERVARTSVEETAPQRSTAIDKATWLANVRARAATTPSKTDSHSNLAVNGDGALDVDATEADSYEPGRGNAISAIAGNDGNDPPSNRAFRGRSRRKADSSSWTSRSAVDDDDEEGTSLDATLFLDSSFESLMRIARMGPAGAANVNSRRRNVRNGREPHYRTVPVGSSASDANVESRASPRSNGSSLSGQATSRRSDASSLLGLTKEIISSQDYSKNEEDDYEETDNEMEQTVRLDRTTLPGAVKRQQFPAVRRFGGRTRRILERPEEWRPLTEEQVSNVTSDSRSLTGDSSGGQKFIESDCSSCVGSGMETCKLCMGEGWLTPVKLEHRKDYDDGLLRLIDEVWSLPNLVISSDGEAQCVRCNGVGKEFCRECKGSGSAVKKGFDLSEKYRVFDIFSDTGEGPSLDEIDFEWDEVDVDESDEDEEGDEDEYEAVDMDTFQLYQGSPDTTGKYPYPSESFDFGAGKKNLRIDTKGEQVDEDEEFEDDIDVVDESAELLETLEAMDMQDVTDRRPTLDERLGIRRKPLRVGSVEREEDDDDDDVDDDTDSLGFGGVDADEDVDSFRVDLDDEDDEVVGVSRNMDTADLENVDDFEAFDDDDDFKDDPDDGFQEAIAMDEDVDDGVYKQGVNT